MLIIELLIETFDRSIFVFHIFYLFKNIVKKKSALIKNRRKIIKI